MRVEQVVMLEDTDRTLLGDACNGKAVEALLRQMRAALKEGDDLLRRTASNRGVDRDTMQQIEAVLTTRLQLVSGLPDGEAKDTYTERINAALSSVAEARELMG